MTVAGILYLMAETFKIEILDLLDRYFYAEYATVFTFFAGPTVAKLHAFIDNPLKIVEPGNAFAKQ